MGDRDSATDAVEAETDDEVSREFEWAETNPSSAVVQTVAAATNTDPTELVPIQHTIDADALDRLAGEAALEANFRISFEYADTVTTVTGDGVVTVALDGR